MKKKLVKIFVLMVVFIFSMAFLGCDKTSYVVSYVAGEGGTVVGTISQTIEEGGSSETVKAEPSPGYKFTKWSDEKTEAERAEANVTENATITAYFELLKKEEVVIETFSIIYSYGAGGTISGKLAQAIKKGESGEMVIAEPNPGYKFTKWSDGRTGSERVDVNVTSDISVTASFEMISYNISYAAGTGGTISGVANQTLFANQEGSNVSAVPNEGYVFIDWSDGLKESMRKAIRPTTDIAVMANFEKRFTAGRGTLEKPYIISTYDEFLSMTKQGTMELYFKLACDLDFSGIRYEPLFSDKVSFNGELNGSGYSIKNMTISTANQYPSLLGYVGKSGTVKNLNVVNFNIDIKNLAVKETEIYGGSVAGVSLGALTGIRVSGIITAQNEITAKGIGGIVGKSAKAMRSCHAEISIVFTSKINNCDIGGVAGIAGESILECSAKGAIKTVEGGASIGGLVGKLVGGKDTEYVVVAICFASVDIEGGETVGGLIGEINSANKDYYISSSYATGNISKCTYGGGFLGNVKSTRTNIFYCYATGDVVSGTASGFCGGVFINVYFYKSYATGNVTGTTKAAGFASYVIGNVEECFSTGTVKGGNMVSGFLIGNIGAIKNCYSTSDIIITKSDVRYVSGLVSLLAGKIINSYYSGKISAAAVSDTYGNVGGLIAIINNNSIVKNCHWVRFEDGIAKEGIFDDIQIVENIDFTTHSNLSDIYNLAETLNANSAEPVWVNIPNGTPRLKFLTFHL